MNNFKIEFSFDDGSKEDMRIAQLLKEYGFTFCHAFCCKRFRNVRKGKSVQRRCRKATGLQPKGHDRRAAENFTEYSLWVVLPKGFFT